MILVLGFPELGPWSFVFSFELPETRTLEFWFSFEFPERVSRNSDLGVLSLVLSFPKLGPRRAHGGPAELAHRGQAELRRASGASRSSGAGPAAPGTWSFQFSFEFFETRTLEF